MARACLISALLVAIATCAACNKSDSLAEKDRAAAAADCRRQGGDYRRVCVAQKYMCVLPYPDGGKSCKDSTECAGECRIEAATECSESGKCIETILPIPGDEATGACQRDNDPCGSVIRIQNGRALPGENRD